jgi:hypothetical protein
MALIQRLALAMVKQRRLISASLMVKIKDGSKTGNQKMSYMIINSLLKRP